MPLPIRALPLLEKWDCRTCAQCCRGTIIRLSEDDLKRFRAQKWHAHPDYRGKKLLVRLGWWKSAFRLAKRPDGQCVFLTEENLCRIHRDLGEPAKPLVCRMFPFQIVTLPGRANVTLRRYCPTAARDEGRPLADHMHAIQAMAREGQLAEKEPQPPILAAGARRDWPRALVVGDAVDRMLSDERFPLVRRATHLLAFARLLEQCRVNDLGESEFAALVRLVEESSTADEEIAEEFRRRAAPRPVASMAFRQIVLEHLRLHPGFVVTESWRERWRWVRAALAFARGRGALPFLHECFPPTTFEAVERPLGALPMETLRPLTRFFEANAASRQYLLLARQGWNVVESLRFLAASYAVAMWVARLVSGSKPPTQDDVVGAVQVIDRAQGFAMTTAARHRRRLNVLARAGDLTRLIVWYAR